LSPLLDAAAVADPDSHSLLIPGPLDALAGFQASFSDALRGELHWLAAMRAGERQCRFRHAARIARLSRSTEKLRRVPAGARHGPQGNLVTPGRARSRRRWARPAPCDLARVRPVSELRKATIANALRRRGDNHSLAGKAVTFDLDGTLVDLRVVLHPCPPAGGKRSARSQTRGGACARADEHRSADPCAHGASRRECG